jgi:hypothetical protein
MSTANAGWVKVAGIDNNFASRIINRRFQNTMARHNIPFGFVQLVPGSMKQAPGFVELTPGSMKQTPGFVQHAAGSTN